MSERTSRRPAITRIVAGCILVLTLSGAAACDDIGRAAVRSRPLADDAARYGDDVARAARAAAAADAAAGRAVQRMDEAVRSIETADDTAEGIVTRMVWDAGCSVVADGLPAPDAASIAQWLAERAVAWGLEFTGEAEQALAGAILSALDEPGEESDLEAACERLPQSGL